MVAVVRQHPRVRHLRAWVFALAAALSPMLALAAEPDRDALFLGERLFVHFREPAERITCPDVGLLRATEVRIVRMCWAVPYEWVEVTSIISWLTRALSEINPEEPRGISDWELYSQPSGLVLLSSVRFLSRFYSLSVAIDGSQQHFIELRHAP